MRPIDYETLTDKLIEHYPVQDNPEIYSLYTSMLNHLMKCFKLKHSTAVKLLLKVEEHLGIHLMRDREMTNMKMLNLNKENIDCDFLNNIELNKKVKVSRYLLNYERASMVIKDFYSES